MIVLIRHARAERAEGRYIGRTNLPLCPQGLAQAQVLARELAGLELCSLAASPLTRARQTAAPLARALDLEPVILPDLAEIDLGAWDGKNKDEIRARYPEAYAARGRDFAGFRPPGGESFGDVRDRALAALAALAALSAPVGAVTHAGLIRCLVCALNGLPLQELFSVAVPPASCTLLAPDGHGGWAVRCVGLAAQTLAGMAPPKSPPASPPGASRV